MLEKLTFVTPMYIATIAMSYFLNIFFLFCVDYINSVPSKKNAFEVILPCYVGRDLYYVCP